MKPLSELGFFHFKFDKWGDWYKSDKSRFVICEDYEGFDLYKKSEVHPGQIMKGFTLINEEKLDLTRLKEFVR